MRRRMGRPGLMGMAARTAVVAGTATAVSGSMRNRSQASSQQAADAAAYQQQQDAEAQSAAIAQAVAAQTAAAPPPPPPAAAAGDGMIEALERLATLKSQGILTDEEFAAQKARILGG
ncbi:MAG: SHOCT domain-containing protein [Humibacillus sp.]|nr:SHOCT domain-containing protein [Humibacillus sp.]MDN5778066.1 SHOCT domain-containing protein [Humibacillus sp.]